MPRGHADLAPGLLDQRLVRESLIGSLLLVMQSFLEAVFEVQTKAVVGVGERVGGGAPRQLEDVIELKTNAVVLDVTGAGHEPHRIDEMVFHEQFAIGESIERARLPCLCAQRKLDTRTRPEPPYSRDGVLVRVGRTPPLVARPVEDV